MLTRDYDHRASAATIDAACFAAARLTAEDGVTRYVSHAAAAMTVEPPEFGAASMVDREAARRMVVCKDYATEHSVSTGDAARSLGLRHPARAWSWR